MRQLLETFNVTLPTIEKAVFRVHPHVPNRTGRRLLGLLKHYRHAPTIAVLNSRLSPEEFKTLIKVGIERWQGPDDVMANLEERLLDSTEMTKMGLMELLSGTTRFDWVEDVFGPPIFDKSDR